MGTLDRNKHWLIHILMWLLILVIAPMLIDCKKSKLTIEDWIILYEQSLWHKISVEDIYWDKNTIFKKYILWH